jgi:Tfp pilus assembly protein PilE
MKFLPNWMRRKTLSSIVESSLENARADLLEASQYLEYYRHNVNMLKERIQRLEEHAVDFYEEEKSTKTSGLLGTLSKQFPK